MSPKFPAVLLVLTLFIAPLLYPASVSAAPKEFALNSSGSSHIYWPFEDSSWAVKGDWFLNDGSGLHENGDKRAQDWNIAGPADCGKVFLSPISGQVIFAGQRNPDNGFGQQVVVHSNVDSAFALRTAHLQVDSIEVEVGDNVNIGDPLGKVGDTGGTSTGCHAHIALYKDLGATEVGLLSVGSTLPNKANSARFKLNAKLIDSCSQEQFRMEVFNNTDLSGDPRYSGCVNKIDFDWGENSIIPIQKQNKVSMRFEGQFELTSAVYEFSTLSDDGVHVWVDEQLVIDNWTQHGPTIDLVDVPLDNGVHDIRVEYFEFKNGAQLTFTKNIVEVLNHPPVVTQIPDQTITLGNQFASFDLDDFVTEPDIGDSVSWSYTGNAQLNVQVDANNVVDLIAPAATPLSETITFTATDTRGGFASTSPTFTIESDCDSTIVAGDVGAFVLAMDAANSNPDHTTICLTAGTPYQFSTVHNQTYGQTGIGVVGTPVTIDGRGATIQRDPGPNVGMRFFAINPSGSLELVNMTINNGHDVTNNYGGGAVLNYGGNLVVNDVNFTNNTARSFGGGAISTWQNGDTVISNSTFTGNTALTSGSGGALSVRGATTTMSVTDSLLQNNTAANIGGAIYNQGQVTVAGSRFLTNSTLNGGSAVFNLGNITADNSCFVGNSDSAVWNVAANTIDFANNWWGAASGPDTTPGYTDPGDSIQEPVDYIPFLTSAPGGC